MIQKQAAGSGNSGQLSAGRKAAILPCVKHGGHAAASYAGRAMVLLQWRTLQPASKGPDMRVDIYRRSEAEGRYSHLAVPEGKPIPQEAINTDWNCEHRAVERDETQAHWNDLGIPEPGRQLRDKGYAITSVTEQPRR